MIYCFGRFQVDDEAFRLTADGKPVSLEPKTLRLLIYLVQHSGRLNHKQELLDAIWPAAAVTENALTRSIGLLRKSLEDDSREPCFIETVPTAGYRFIAPIDIISAPSTGDFVPLPTIPPTPTIPLIRLLESTSQRHLLRFPVFSVCCLTILAAVLWIFVVRPHSRSTIHSLAVLPLMNLSGDPSQDYFADGMTDELITELAHITDLRVVSHTSVMFDKNRHESLRDMARRLDVDAIVEGSTVRSGDRIRITAQLIDTRTDRHLWAESFEGSASDVLTLQDSVASQIASQARLVLLLSPPRAQVNPAAHDALLRGRYFFHKQDFTRSVAAYQQAISIEPNYAAAYSGYSAAYEALASFGFKSPDEVIPRALAAARRAIELDPNDGEAFTELGSIQTIYSWEWSLAEQNLVRGIYLNPNDSIAEFKFAAYLDAVGRPQEAVTHMRRAVVLDPLSFIMNRRMGATLYLARDYDGALAEFQRAAEMEDSPRSIDNYLSLIYEQKGERDLAIENDVRALQAKYPEVDANALFGIYREKGWQPYWRAQIRSLLNIAPSSCKSYLVGIDSLRVGNLDRAFDFFQHAIDQHCISMTFIRVDPLLDSVRQDPRYATLSKRLHQ